MGAGGNSPWFIVMANADEARSATTALADDPVLSFPLGVGKHHIRGRVALNAANATMDFKHQYNFTGTATDVTHRRQQPTGQAGSTDNETTVTGQYLNTSLVVLGGAGDAYVEVDIFLVVTVAGTFSFQWCQNTSDAGALTRKATSYLEYREAA